MVDIKKLMEYSSNQRRKYLATLAKLPWSEFIKDKGASWGSLRNIFVHTVSSIDYWLDFILKERAHSRKHYEDYVSLDDIRNYMVHVETRMQKYLRNLSDSKLQSKFTVKNDLDETVEITAEDVLIHVFEEEIYHLGELNALLWQLDVEPPVMGWKGL